MFILLSLRASFSRSACSRPCLINKSENYAALVSIACTGKRQGEENVGGRERAALAATLQSKDGQRERDSLRRPRGVLVHACCPSLGLLISAGKVLSHCSDKEMPSVLH